MAPPTPPLPTVDKDYDSASECYFPPMCERVSFTLVELFQLRCNECPSCLRRNCNKCLSCHNNKLSTTRDPQVCYFNVSEIKYSFYHKDTYDFKNCSHFLFYRLSLSLLVL